MSGFVITAEARRDLAELADYIADHNPDAARRMRVQLSRTIERLAARPHLGHARPDITDKPVRFWTVASRYLVVYRVEPAGITVLRVLGRGRDVAALLR